IIDTTYSTRDVPERRDALSCLDTPKANRDVALRHDTGCSRHFSSTESTQAQDTSRLSRPLCDTRRPVTPRHGLLTPRLERREHTSSRHFSSRPSLPLLSLVFAPASKGGLERTAHHERTAGGER